MKIQTIETSLIMAIIVEAIKQIRSPRLFNSERGFRGQLQSNLNRLLREKNLTSNRTLIEEEYQKRIPDHGISYRPDIIIHIPFEEGITKTRREGNFVAFELKLHANENDALGDFCKLNDYITLLKYPLGVFVNIGSEKSFIELVPNNKIHVLNVLKDKQDVIIVHSYLKNGKAICQRL